MKRAVRIIVIGGNAAGASAAAKAKRFNPNVDVILFEASEFISTGTCEMPYIISNEIDDYRKIVFFSPASFQTKKGVKVFVKHFVEEIDTRQKQVSVKDLAENKIRKYDYDCLILSTGSKPKTLPGFNTDLKNVFTLKNVDDLIRINNYIKNNKFSNAIIIGSGYIGLEAAEALAQRKIKIKILEKESLPLPSADVEFSTTILNILNKNDIDFSGGIVDTEPVIADGSIKAVKIGNQFIETDLVLISVGFTPDITLAEYAKLEIGKHDGIKVDRYLKTSNSYIYAAGDNAEVLNAVTGKTDYIPLATHAHTLGHIAGENAAGGSIRYEPVVKNISVRLFDKFFAVIGLNEKEVKENKYDYYSIFTKAPNLVKVMPGSNEVIGKIICEKSTKRILGASFLGGKEVSGYADLISALIKLKVPAYMLSKINYNYTPPLSPFINLLSIIGKQVK